MAGIPLCKHNKCAKKKDCYRFNAPPQENTSEANYHAICTESNNYKYFYGEEKTLEAAEAEVVNK